MIAGGIAALALIGSVGAALAAPAYATTNTNVRSGPGTGYDVIDVLRTGDRVDVQQCRGSWCYIAKNGPDGWVSASLLDRGGGYGGGYQRPPIIVAPPVYRPPVYYPPVYHPRPPIYRPPYGRPPYGRPPHWGGNDHGHDHGRPHRGNDNGFCINGSKGSFCLN
jgi:uncharacterized protein YraI